MNRWNNADTTLLCAAICFVVAVVVNKIYPASILGEGFLFVTEAAMVGGIADWFAVTALFKKPLGFPFHTAILPNRRQEFINASTQMVQQEFFSRRTIFKKVGNVQILPLVINYLEQPQTRQMLLNEILKALQHYMTLQSKSLQAKLIANKLRRQFDNIPATDLIDVAGKWIRANGKDIELFIGLVKKLREVAAKPSTKVKLQEVLENFAAERTQSAGAFSLLMAGLAQMLNFVNFEEAAEIMQVQLVKFLDELATDSPIQRRTLSECRIKISELTDTPEFRDLVERLQVDLTANLPLEVAIEAALRNIEIQLLSTNINELLPVAQDKQISAILAEILINLYNRLIESLKSDTEIKSIAEKFIHELTARAALYAQPLIGEIAKSTLSRMDVEQLNNLVYDKAEPDFVWIRMNGSIVGSIVGLAIFVLIKAVS